MKKNFKLLSKTSIVYLIVTFIVFFVTAFFLFQEIDNYLDEEVEGRFKFGEHRIMRALSKGHKPKKSKMYLKIEKISSSPEMKNFPIYKDTLIEDSESEKASFCRTKEIILKNKNDFYQIKMITRLDEFVLLKHAIANILIPAFGILAFLVVLINFVLSGFFFKPFHKILCQIKTYKVNENTNITKVNTSTLEFQKMQSLFIGMVERIEDDYKNLKEYTENMAHEIQTPLAVMRNKVLDLMSDENLMADKSLVIKSIYDEINHLSILGKTLNLLTKIENNEFKNCEKINTKEVLSELCAIHKELAELKQIDLEIKLSEENYLLIDPKLLRIMIDNLLRNALRYSSTEGTIKVISTKESIQISNYGDKLKINPEKIFERFVSQNDDNNSIGLGLSIVKKICELNSILINYSYVEGQHLFTLKSNCISK